MNNRLLVDVRMLTVSSDTEEYALIVMNLIKLMISNLRWLI